MAAEPTWRRLAPGLLLGLVVLLTGLACNLVSQAPPTAVFVTPTPAEVAADAGAPSVEILWPPNGSAFAMRQEIPIQVRATDAVGITRLELRSANSVFSSVPSPERNGQMEFQAILPWTPNRSGLQDLEVVAYRRRVPSDPVPLQLNIYLRASEISATTIPFDADQPQTAVQSGAACQVRINIDNLRYRTGPGTSYEILGFLELGEVLNITGQNVAGAWWQAERNGQTIWVSSGSSYSTELTNCDSAPIVQPPG